MKWFGHQWENSEHAFNAATSSTWIIGKKLSERFVQREEAWAQKPNRPGAAWGVFLCEKKDHPEEKFVMKIYMQIPWKDSEMDTPEKRKLQARSDLSGFAINELSALSELRDKGSTGTPVLVDNYQTKQTAEMCVPDGFLLFIVMTYCPGSPVQGFPLLPFSLREDMRRAFKVAYKECLRCGILTSGHVWENLLWDNATKRCHIVDFKLFVHPVPPWDVWSDRVFEIWDLQERREYR